MSIATQRQAPKAPKAPWDTRDYRRIVSAMAHAGVLTAGFGDGSHAHLDVRRLLRPGEAPEWERMTFTPFEIVVPSEAGDIEIPWSTIRALTDPAYEQHLATKFAEQARLIGERVRGLRQSKDLGVQELADQAGISPERLARIEAGEDGISLPTLEWIVAALGHDMRVFVVDEDGART